MRSNQLSYRCFGQRQGTEKGTLCLFPGIVKRWAANELCLAEEFEGGGEASAESRGSALREKHPKSRKTSDVWRWSDPQGAFYSTRINTNFRYRNSGQTSGAG